MPLKGEGNIGYRLPVNVAAKRNIEEKHVGTLLRHIGRGILLQYSELNGFVRLRVRGDVFLAYTYQLSRKFYPNDVPKTCFRCNYHCPACTTAKVDKA